jgi:LysM repeat protein
MNNLLDHLCMDSNRPKIYFLMGILACFTGQAYCVTQQKNSRQEYIDVFAKYAIQEMKEYHIPASITMAQACLESGDGNSPLALKANNHFGIKCKSDWTGPSVKKDDDSPDECFRKYGSALESYRDHSKFLTGGMRYQFLFDYDIKDYKKWAYGLKRAGYATDPQYPERLLKIIEEFQLYRLDEYYNSQTSYAGSESSGVSLIPMTKHKWGRGDNNLINPYISRKVEKRNGSKAFFAKKGDTYERIAAEFSLKEWEIYKYNDLVQGDRPEAGSIVYLQRKRGSAPRGNDFHILKQGESIWSVAQWYGIRLNALCRKNRMTKGEEPDTGQQISLRKKVSR